MTTTVLIADGQPVLREGLAELLASQREFVVAAEAATTDDAVECARTRHPDIALLALDLPGGGGLATARRIRRESPQTRLIVLVPPRRDPGPVPDAVATVSYAMRADQVLDRILAARTAALPGATPRVPAVRPLAVARLTRREEQVCALIAAAYTNRQIEAQLGIRSSSVKRHVRQVLRKFGAHNRIEVAIAMARQATMKGGPA